jgi:predicted dehydrogenase
MSSVPTEIVYRLEVSVKKLRLGVLGTSRIYALRVAPLVKCSLLVEPFAIASRDVEKTKKYGEAQDFSRAHNAYEALLAYSVVDFVISLFQNHLHFKYIKQAANAGKPIICEKLLCLNAQDAVN